MLLLKIRFGKTNYLIKFMVVENIAVEVIIGTVLINDHVI